MTYCTQNGMELASLYTKEELISVADFARVDNCMSGNKDKYPIGNDFVSL
jgi:hypothetical protein